MILLEGVVTHNGLTGISSLFTFFVARVVELVKYIVDKPLLLLPLGIFVVGSAIGLAKRLIGR